MSLPPTHFLFLIFKLTLLFHVSILNAYDHPDLQPLLSFKSTSDVANKLTTWTNSNSSDPCISFLGVTCLHNRVTKLVLENLNLEGRFDSLNSLTHLRILSLKNNHLTGPVPDLSNLSSLKLLFLSNNFISGDFPPSVTSLFGLYRLDLSFNNFSGEVPVTLNTMIHLLTLRLENNQFSGDVTVLKLNSLQELNISNNQFSGEIPPVLASFPVTAFENNKLLCGAPLSNCTEPSLPGVGEGEGKPASTVVASSPSSMPSTASLPLGRKKSGHGGGSKISTVAIVAIIVGDVVVLGLVSLILYCYFWRNYNGKSKSKSTGHGQILEGEKIVYSSSPYPNLNPAGSVNTGFERGRMVFFEGARKFELEDLLRASAEMLGKGGFGDRRYKAGFDMEMCRGNRGPGRTPLDWTTRLKVAAGAARGLVFIHHSCRSLKLTHGNIKSTNILLDKTGNACVSDFGLSAFAPPTTAPKSNGYRAPELLTMDVRKTTQKSDVYSFGVLLLELLTGKCPSVMDNGGTGYGGAVDLPRWVQSVVREEWTAEVFDLELMRYKDIEEEMVGLLQIAMSCTAAAPDQRPTMGYVLKMIEEIRGVEVSPSHEMLESVSDSPSISDDTCRASE
ncbi:probable leucine-rich repeat receptor-like protein kinase [Tanacetum coccineum]